MITETYVLIVFIFCYFYVFISSLLEHRKWNYIHETAVALVIGAIAGMFIFFFTNLFVSDFKQTLQQLVFIVLLPLMLFEDGYNIPKRKFFQNIFYANLYALLGFIIQLGLMYGIVYALSQYSTRNGSQQVIQLYNWQILILCACFTSMDTVVAEKVVNAERYPKLFSIIFGQSILKDTIAVTLYQAIIKVYNKTQYKVQFRAYEFGILAGIFIESIICSILIGIAIALITTFLFKHFRFLTQSHGVSEVSLVIITGYISYLASEWAQFSGVISMLFCGITLSHFNIYNMTEEGKVVTKSTISFLALLAEGILFFMVGAYLFNIQYQATTDGALENGVSYTLFGMVMVCIVVGRAISIALGSLLGWLVLAKDKWRLNIYDLQIIYGGGLVRGAVPFALVLTIPQSNTNQGICIVTTVTFVVFLTSLIFNNILPAFLRNRLDCTLKMFKQNPDHPSLRDSFLIKYKTNQAKVVKSSTQKYWNKLQEGFIKPFFIYKYYERKDEIKKQKIKAREEEYQEYLNRFNLKKQDLEANESQSALSRPIILTDQQLQQEIEDFNVHKAEK